VKREAIVEVAVDLAANDHRQDYVRASFEMSPDGARRARPFGKQDSSMMKIFAQADCLIIRPPNAPALEAGAPCPVMLLRPALLP
jgi:molybdopterin molybdotransferase